MKTIDNLRAGPRIADELAAERERLIGRARSLFETEFMNAVLTDNPMAEVSRMATPGDIRETVPIADLFTEMIFEGAAAQMHRLRLLNLIAHPDDEHASITLRAFAQEYADEQIELLLQRGAL